MTDIPFQDFTRELSVHGLELRQAIDRVLTSGNYILGTEVAAFEAEFESYLGVTHAIGVANGLEAIQIALMALGIGKGDEVITTPYSAVATTLAILAVGAVPVFADVQKNGLINPEKVFQLYTKRTKAILPVHLFGNAADLGRLEKFSQENDLYLLEDAAQAHGALYGTKKVGSIGILGCYSFYPTKNLGAIGDGGAITTNDPGLAQVCREIRDYGQREKYVHVRQGMNSRLDELQAALLRTKLSYLDQDTTKRRELAARYESLLSDVFQVEVIPQPMYGTSVYHLFVIRTKKRDQLKKYLAEKGIATAVHYPIPIPDQPFLRDQFGSASIPVARQLVKEVLSLPCHPYLTDEEQNAVVMAIKDFFST